MLTPYQREVAAALRPQTPLARRALVLRTLRSDIQASPQGTAQALGLLNISTGSTLGSISTAVSAAGLALAPAEIAAELALGTNPFTAIPFIAFDIASLTGLIPSFAGKPKLLDSVQAVQRLAQSRLPEVQQLAANLAIFVRNGVPLSTSNTAQQAQLRQWIGGAVQTLLAQRGLPATGQNVTLLDEAIRNVLTSEVAAPGSRIDQTIAQLGGSPGSPVTTVSAQPPPSLSLRPIRSPNPGPVTSGPVSVPQPQPGAGWPSELTSLYQRLEPYLGLAEKASIVLCLGTWVLAVASEGAFATTAAVTCLQKLAIGIAAQGAKDILQALERYLNSFGGQPSMQQPGGPVTAPQPGSPGQPAPILDQKSDCPSCTPQGRRLQRQLSQQKTQTLRDIQREQEQLTEQELTQQAQQLSQLESTETQPQSIQQIEQSLQQKQQVLQQIEQEQQTLGGQPGGQPGSPVTNVSQPAPQLQPSSSQAAQQEIQQELQQQQSSEAIQFCVGCQSQEDAILFLNGEPSKCSVIPGSTKQINV